MKNLYKLTILILISTISTNMIADGTQPPGSGTVADPYQVSILDHLLWISTTVSAWNKDYEQTANIDAYASSTWNSDGQGGYYGFSPIGNMSTSFEGSYDGAGHTIEGLYINRSSTNYIGFIGNVYHATIENLGVINVNITGNSNTGALVGTNTQYTSITNCYSTGNITGEAYVGGLVGYNSISTISNSYTTCSVRGESQDYIGGLVGYIQSSSTISNCYSRGDVTRSVGNTSVRFGGFCGAAQNSTIEYCYSTGSVFYDEESNPSDKGFVGDDLWGVDGNTFTDNFWDSEASNQGSSAGATAKTTSEMKTLSTFTGAGWDFIGDGNGPNDYWNMDGITRVGYAFLSYETQGWTGTTSSDWFNVSNWHSGSIPSSDQVVSIANTSTMPYISGSTLANCTDIIIASGRSLTIAPESKFTVENDIHNIGTLTIESDATGTGSLIVDGFSTGNISFERYVTGDLWHYISSPVNGQDINDTWMTNNNIVLYNTSRQFFRWDEPTNYWIIYGDALFNDTEFGDATGYSLTRSADGDINFTGTVRTTDVTYSATYNSGQGDGFDLVGNPFTSSIGITSDASSTDNFLNDNNATLDASYKAVYIWDEQTGYSGGRNDYKVICNTGYSGYGSGSALSQDYVQPGQAFLIKVSSANIIHFNADTRYHSSIDFHKSGNKNTWPGVELVVQSGETLQNSTIVTFNNEMTLGLDPSYDVGKLKGNPNIALYTSLVEAKDVTDFAIQALPDDNIENLTVTIGIDVSEEMICDFSIYHELMESWPIFLEDTKEKTFTNLKEQNYSTLVNESGTGRFLLHFKDVTGIEDDIYNKESIRCYASDKILYIINPVHKKGFIRIFNLSGQEVANLLLTGDKKQEQSLNVENVILIVHIQTSKEVISNKVLVK